MNTTTPTPAPVPPQLPPSLAIPHPAPLGELPGERDSITSPIGAVEAILRQPRRLIYQLRQPRSGQLIAGMLTVAVLCSLVYGVVVGTFSMGTQLWAAPVKIALGLMISALICLPSLYIFTCLSGSQARLSEMCGLLAGLLMLMTILLIGFAPVAWLFSQSTTSVAWMGTLHILFWLVATLFGVRFLLAGFSHSHARSVGGLAVWVILFVLVVLQMTTALRPIVGEAKTLLPTEKKFFLAHWAECMTPDARPATPPKAD